MDEEIDDYVGVEYVTEIDNSQTVSNIRQLNSPQSENEILRVIKFFQLLNFNKSTNQKDNENHSEEIKKKQKILNILNSSKDHLDELMVFLNLATLDKPLYKMKVLNIDTEKISEKKELKKINYLKKVDCFSKSINNLNKSLKEMSERNKISQTIFRELNSLKELGFSVEDNFKFPNFKDTVSVKLNHKLIRIYENLNMFSENNEENSLKKFHSKFSFDLDYNSKSNSFELHSKFYDNFINKLKICFELTIKTQDGLIIQLDKNNFNIILEELILEKLRLNLVYKNSEKYNLKTYLVFYTKYFLYILFKLEIRNLMKVVSETGNNSFEFKNFQFVFNENVKEFSVNLNHFNFMKVNFKIWKESIEMTEINSTNEENIEMFNGDNFLHIKQNNNHYNNISNTHINQNYSFLIKTLLRNLIYDVHIYKIINDVSLLNFNFKLAFYDILDNSIFINNITKISNVILRKSLIDVISNKLDKAKNFYVNKQCIMNPTHNSYTYRFVLYNNSLLTITSHNSKIEFSVSFNKGNFSFEIKNPLKNNIFICERELTSETSYKKMDFNYILLFLDNIINL